MKITELRDKDQMAAHLRRNLYLNIYQLGDLDDYYWPDTRWWALTDGDKIEALVLLYTGLSVPTLLVLADQDIQPYRELLTELLPQLPQELYLHYTSGLEDVLSQRYDLKIVGACLKMGLEQPELIDAVDISTVEQLTIEDEAELHEFYKTASPGNWFDRRMLATEHYFGIRHDNKIASVAGVHVVSHRYKVAALGNIATAPNYRGRGLAKQTTAKVCRVLLDEGCRVGLNVMADNVAAIRCYTLLGFHEAGHYIEAQATVRN